ncbi:hypothetical protein KI387_034224 [Taxus chinensis]|uniref:Uncharacterized protein n=1 Tax=Taxus chinensis TaxID=29808 RepID=A0AA38C4R2_TAXCH|nr:hypothetical protein KI387_034224 [Taxus chinensis]
MQWMCNNKYQEVKRSDLAEIGSRALAKALTPANIRAGFRRTGIWPLDPNALQNDMECSKLYIIEEDANEDDAENVTDDDTTENIMNVDGTENIIDVDAAENILSLSRDVAPPVGDKIGENYLMESVENLSTTQEVHPTIETMVVANTETEEPSIQGESQSIMQTKDYEVNHIVNTRDQGTSSCNTEAQGFGEDDLSLPSAPEQPTWLQEHIAELGLDQIGNTEDESISLPSMPTNLVPIEFEPTNFTHYYADAEKIEVIDKDKNEEETTGHDVESGISNDGVAANEKKLGKFLRLLTQFVRDPSKGKSDAALRISRASQLLTSDAYRKKEHIEAKKQERLAAKEQKKEERLQRIKERQERDLQNFVERQEREKQREVARQKKELELQQKEATRHQREKEKQERDNKFNNPQLLIKKTPTGTSTGQNGEKEIYLMGNRLPLQFALPRHEMYPISVKIADLSGDKHETAVAVLKSIGNVHWVEIGFLSMVATGLERPEIIESNGKESLKLRKSMNDLFKVITQLKLLSHLKDEMQTKIKECIHLMVGGATLCCFLEITKTFGRVYMALKGRQDLDELNFQVDETWKTPNDQMNASIIDDVHNRMVCSPSQGPCQNDAVGTVQQIYQVVELLDWENDKLAVVVVTRGIGGAGKIILTDAVYASLKEKFHGWKHWKATAELNLVKVNPWRSSLLMKDVKSR